MTWRLFIARVRGDETLGQFEADVETATRYIGKAGELSAKIEIPNEDVARRLLTCVGSEASLSMYLAQGDLIWWGGLLDKDSISSDGGKLTVTLAGATFEGYLDRREARRNQYESIADQFVWARGMVIEATGTPDSDIGLTIPDSGLSGVKRQLSFKDEDSTKWGAMLATMANRADGFDWVIDVTGTPWERQRTLILAYPSLARPNGYTIPAAAVRSYTETRDRTAGATSWRIRGEAPEGSSGTDVPAPMSDVFDATDILAAGGLRTDKTVTRQGMSIKANLDADAAHLRDTMNGSTRLLDVTCDLEAIDPGILGAYVRVRLVDLMHPALEDGTPTLDQVRRCIGYTIKPAKRGEKDTAQLLFEEPTDAEEG
ncbi:hypothetical protein [Psychromicrobium lacuslunae]|uniref:Uncharacterized protein n=1 Tax=Psychromicrobium lacuslunae TaxID=1618207 RepID=A0A0D4C1Y3_9MICC|nr:hypothetical protein [Psychromicrobium lacuslunae]AJT42425.1 hypothetical protein UM93_14635 [Psychromicrobium lacuslunae]